MRKLATVRRIDEILPIEGADAIECAVLGGWKVVIKKGDFKAGDLAVYCEPDSWVPHELAPFLSKGHEPREYNGVRGERLRTIRLRGQLSQGLLIPAMGTFPEGTDMTDALGIQKWEAPIPTQLSGNVSGGFPSQIPKTDEERIQNLTKELAQWMNNPEFIWEISEKLDGSSMTVYNIDGKFGVCSRNWDLTESADNTFWKQARDKNIEEILRKEGNFAIQGELIGEGIQKNPYGLNGHDFMVYNVFNINEQRYLTPVERYEFISRNALKQVPILYRDFVITGDVFSLLSMAEGKSVLNKNTEREGLVFKCAGKVSFKAISNKFLLKNGD